MKPKHIGYLISLLLVLALLSVFGQLQRGGQGQPVSQELLSIDTTKVERLEMEDSSQRIVLERQDDDTWKLIEPVEDQVDMIYVNAALETIESLSVGSVVSQKVDNFTNFQLTDDAAFKVTIKQASSEDTTTLLIGKNPPQQFSQQYVRLEGQDQVYISQDNIKIAFDRQLKEWRNKEILRVDFEKITGVSRWISNELAWQVSKDDQGQWVLADGQLADQYAVDGVVVMLANLSAIDFPEEIDFDTKKPNFKMVLQTDDQEYEIPFYQVSTPPQQPDQMPYTDYYVYFDQKAYQVSEAVWQDVALDQAALQSTDALTNTDNSDQ